MNWFRSLPPKKAAILALIIANIIWGAASPIFKWSLTNISLFTLAYFRFFVSSLILLPFVLKYNLAIAKKDWLTLLFISLSGISINITFFFLGLKYAPSINAPIISSSGPIILIIAAIIFLHEKPRHKTILGTCVSLIGVLIIIARPLFEEGFDFSAVSGNVFFLLATIGAVVHTIFYKEIGNKYSALVITFWSFIIGSLTFFPFFTYEMVTGPGFSTLDIRGITGLVFGIFLSSTFAYLIWAWAMKRIDASEAGLFTYIDPVIAAFIAVPLLGELITPLFVLGSLFVFLGIFIAEGRLHYHPLHKL